MKKLLALGLSLAMMASLSAVAFAASGPVGTKELTADHNSDTTVVKTVVTDDAEDWTVTIPAEIDIDWGDTATVEGDVTITGQIKKGATVTVALDTDVSNFKLSNTAGDTLDCDIEFAGLTATADTILGAGVTTTVGATVADWSAAPIDVYQNTLTFTATYA